MGVTKSNKNNISSPKGNSLALFVDYNDGNLKLKDINGNVENFTAYAGSMPVGVLQMEGGVPLDGTLRAVQDQNGNNSPLFLSTHSVTGRGKNRVLTDTVFGEIDWQYLGGKNTIIGIGDVYTVQTGTGGSENIAIGFTALYQTTGLVQGNQNIAIGYEALKYNYNASSRNIAIGRRALLQNNFYESSIAIGNDAISGNSATGTSSNDISIGYGSGNGINGGYNIAIGHLALQWNSFGVMQIGSIEQTGGTADSHSIYIGSSYGLAYGNLLQNVNIGIQGSNLSAPLGIGNRVNLGAATQGYLVAIGVSTGESPTGVGTAIGIQALFGCTNNDVFAFGHKAFGNTNVRGDNFAFGTYVNAANAGIGYALAASQTSTGNTFFGHKIVVQPTETGQSRAITRCTYVGMNIVNPSSTVTTAHSNNTVIGNSFYRVTSSSNTTIIGDAVGTFITTGTAFTGIGNGAGNTLTTGANNTFVGFSSGTGITTGSNNVFLGNDTVSNSIASTRLVVIGGNISATANDATMIGRDIVSFGNSLLLGNSATGTALNQFVVGSASVNAGAIAVESLTSDTTWTVRINGTQYKMLLKA
jgi:hypothetical protein